MTSKGSASNGFGIAAVFLRLTLAGAERGVNRGRSTIFSQSRRAPAADFGVS